MDEAAAMEQGLHVALRAGVTAGIFESDSLEVVELVNMKTSSMAEIYQLIAEILEKKKKKNFQNFKAQHISRNYNGTAHELAKLALQKQEIVSWLDEIPTNILYLCSS